MVRSYSEAVSSGNSTIFIRLLAMWKGSLYKLVWCDMVIYIIIYYIINFIYRFGLSPDAKVHFENIVHLCENIRTNIPISFILGFLVAGVIGRWWLLYEAIPYPDAVAFFVQSFTEGHGNPSFEELESEVEGKPKKTVVKDPENYESFYSDSTRFHLMRYVMLSWTLLMLRVSEQITERFNIDYSPFKKPGRAAPLNVSCIDLTTEESIVQMREQQEIEKFYKNLNSDPEVKRTFGMLMTKEEMEVFQELCRSHRYIHGESCGMEFWVPLQWASRLIQKAGVQGYFCDARLIGVICNRINRLREQMQVFFHQSEIIIPLVYTQVVVIVVYTYFLAQIFASQLVPEHGYGKQDTASSTYLPPKMERNVSQPNGGTENVPPRLDMVVPIFDILVFLFLIGWLKVAICVLNPFGGDDEDFEIAKLLTSNLHRCYDAAISDCFPNSLPRARMSYFQIPSAKDDNLKEFLEENQRVWEDKNLQIGIHGDIQQLSPSSRLLNRNKPFMQQLQPFLWE